MHALLLLCPNQVPIAINTTLGPSGPTTALLQRPSEIGSDGEDKILTFSLPFSDATSAPTAVSFSLLKNSMGKRTDAQTSTQLCSVTSKAINSKLRHDKQGIKECFIELHAYISNV